MQQSKLDFKADPNRRYTPDGHPESLFRQRVRDVLGLDWSARDDQIVDEVLRLKALEAKCQASQ